MVNIGHLANMGNWSCSYSGDAPLPRRLLQSGGVTSTADVWLRERCLSLDALIGYWRVSMSRIYRALSSEFDYLNPLVLFQLCTTARCPAS
jgi:hypothetical protein